MITMDKVLHFFAVRFKRIEPSYWNTRPRWRAPSYCRASQSRTHSPTSSSLQVRCRPSTPEATRLCHASTASSQVSSHPWGHRRSSSSPLNIALSHPLTSQIDLTTSSAIASPRRCTNTSFPNVSFRSSSCSCPPSCVATASATADEGETISDSRSAAASDEANVFPAVAHASASPHAASVRAGEFTPTDKRGDSAPFDSSLTANQRNLTEWGAVYTALLREVGGEQTLLFTTLPCDCPQQCGTARPPAAHLSSSLPLS